MAQSLVDVRILQREYLLAISRALTAELDLPDVFRIILKAAVELPSGRAGMIALVDPDTGTLRVSAVYGIPPHLVDHFAPLLRGIPYVEGQEQEAIPELTRQLQHIAQEADMGLRSVIRLPMISGDTVIGLIYVFLTDANRVWLDNQSGLLRSFAEQAAIAVRNARLYEQVSKEKQRLNAILEQSADGVMILDPALHITVFNKSLSRMTGWPAGRAIGKLHSDVIHWQSLKTESTLNEAIENGWPLPGSAHLYVEGDLKRYQPQNGQSGAEVISLAITYAPLLDENGKMINIIANVRDLTRYREEEELQKTFISVVSHELKTPVSIIKGYAGTLRRQDANWSPEVFRESLQVIEEEADNLTSQINNLLEASRLQAGLFKLELSDDANLKKLANDTIQRFAGQSKKHVFQLDFPKSFPVVFGDVRRLQQVLSNLVSNAIKYSPNGGRIVVTGQVHPEHITLSVQDEGIGIPEHEQNRIFQKFSRLDNAMSRKTEGTGLGLFLTKAIIEAHNGRIWFANNENQPGTTFTFSLPRN